MTAPIEDSQDVRQEPVDFEARWETAEAEIRRLKEKLAIAEKERSEAKGNLASMKQALNDAWADRDRHGSRAEQALEAEKKARASYHELKLQFDALMLQTDKLGHRNHQLAYQNEKNGIYALETELGEVRLRAEELERQVSILDASNRVLTQARDDNANTIAELRDLKWELETQVQGLRAELEEKDGRIEQLGSMAKGLVRVAERR